MLVFVSEVVAIQRGVRADRIDVGQDTGAIRSYGGYGGWLAVCGWISLSTPYLRLGVDMGQSITHVEHGGRAEDNSVTDGAIRVLIKDIAHVGLQDPRSVCVCAPLIRIGPIALGHAEGEVNGLVVVRLEVNPALNAVALLRDVAYELIVVGVE